MSCKPNCAWKIKNTNCPYCDLTPNMPVLSEPKKLREFWIKQDGHHWDGYEKYSVLTDEPHLTFYGKQEYKKYREVSPELDAAYAVFEIDVENTIKHSAHLCPNDSIGPTEQCILCMALEKLEFSLAALRKARGET